MSISQLYQEAIKQHANNSTGEGLEFESTHRAEGDNPTCGDEISLYADLLESGEINQVGFEAEACAICKASASLLCEFSCGNHYSKVGEAYSHLKQSLESKQDIQIEQISSLSVVAAHKSRINCALLPWQTLLKALDPITKSE